jgi:GNAT superfamily N-acetyltransferase
MYVDDLVTAEQWRSHGYGRLLNEYLVGVAKKERCTSVQLDSATHRTQAHRFYFRERYTISSFHFVRLPS